MAARAGQDRCSESCSSAFSWGAIVAGDQVTSQWPWLSTRFRVDLIVIVPTPVSASRWVNGSVAVDPLVTVVPGAKVAWCTPRLVNAALFTAVKSAGGFQTSCCIAAQSCLAQAAKYALAVVCGCGAELHAFSSPLTRNAATAMATGPTLLPRLMSRKGTRRRAVPRRNVGPLRYVPGHAHVAHVRLAPGPIAAPGRSARGAGRVSRPPGFHGPRGKGGRGAGRGGRLRPGRAPRGRGRDVRGRAATAARHRGQDRADQRQSRLRPPARVWGRPAGQDRRAPAHPSRQTGPAGPAGGRARTGGRLRRAVSRTRCGPRRVSRRFPKGPRRGARPRGPRHPGRCGRPRRASPGGHGPRVGDRGSGQQFRARHHGRRRRPGARGHPGRLQLRRARPSARPADPRRAPALQRLAAALLVLRGDPPQGQLAGRTRRGRDHAGRARARATVSSPQPAPRPARRPARLRKVHRIRGRLCVGHPHRPEPARGPDGRAADPVPAHSGTRLRPRRRRTRRRLLPGPGRRPRRSGHRGGVRPARQERPGHRRGTAAAHRRVRGRPHGGGNLMRPHRLRVTAFGAFGGTVEVCFDDLAGAGVFLLHGETGAGKTTLLDAIGFALYGRVPGERGKTKRLRSDHAAADTPTEIQLEATMGGRRMRITRKPEQERPKRRGGGTTTEQAKVLLEESDGGAWRAVSTRAGEADEQIRDLMGMSAPQFNQVVLLPQGEFAKFLHATAEDRAKLLQKLFGTDRFRKVEDWLADRRRVTARAVEEAEGGITAHLARVTQVAGLEDSDDPEPSSEPQSASAQSLPGSRLPSATWAAQLAETAAAEALASASQVSSYRGDLDEALDLLRETERLADRQRRRQVALRTRDDLARAEASVRERRGEL